MLNASVGVQRVIGRLRPGQRTRSPLATRLHRRTVDVARTAAGFSAGPHPAVRVALDETVPVAPVPRSERAIRDRAPVRLRLAVRRRVGRDVVVPVAVAAVVLFGSVASVLPDALPNGPVGGPVGQGTGPRIAVGGQGTVLGAVDRAHDPIASDGSGPRFRAVDPEALALEEEPAIRTEPAFDGSFLEDGTLVKPVAVDTSVADGKGLLRSYTVKKGDTLVSIAEAYGVSMMTVWWANQLTSKEVVVGQVLTIPPVSGLIVLVKEGDTLDSLASTYKVGADTIYETNGLEDRALVIGQTLILPGAVGEAIPTPKPTVHPRTTSTTPRVSGPSTYAGGAFGWPVVGSNYISQYFRSGHYGLDIAADYGVTVAAAAPGTVVFAGWKNNCGGYQVWIDHGSGLYTTYNHMSAVSVGAGQSVERGQTVGRIGSSGCVTGPHVHFEVWDGPIWNGGRRVNPLGFF